MSSLFPYSLNASTIRTTPLLRKIEVAAKAGYAGIELWHSEIDEFVEQGGSVRDVRKALDDVGLAVPTTIFLKGWFDCSEKEYPGLLDDCRRKMEQAAELGAPYSIASPPAGKANYELGARRYRELLEIGGSLGVRPVMEFLGFVEEFTTIEDALRVMEACGHPDATTVLDPFHIFRGGGSLDSILKLKKHQIAISHFNDAPASPPREQQRDPDRVMPGEGGYDLKRYLQLLKQTGYRGFLSLELFRPDLWEQDPEQVARYGLEKMRELAEE